MRLCFRFRESCREIRENFCEILPATTVRKKLSRISLPVSETHFPSPLLLIFVVLLGILSAIPAHACTVPVFRYALDHWEADPFRLVVPEAWATDREKVKLLVPLRGNGIANVVVEESADPALDRAKLLFPKEDAVIWEGPLEAPALEGLLDSPVRRELLKRLLEGESVIWVVATEGKDGEETERVASRLSFLEQVAVLPVQDPTDPESRLGPGPPLRLKFSVLSLSLDDPAERHFARMLAGPEHADLAGRKVPFAAPVFGRGRVLGAWPLADLDEATIEEATLFLIGRCSCRVKNENPGWDVVMKADWENALAAFDEGRGESPTVPPVEDRGGEVPLTEAAETIVTAPSAATGGVGENGTGKISWLALAAIAGLLAAGSFLWKRRGN